MVHQVGFRRGRERGSWRLLASGAFAVVLGGALAAPIAASAQARREAATTRMTVAVNKSQTTRLGYAFQDVLVGSSEIADVVPLSDRTLYVLGKKIGTTNVSVFDENKKLVGVIDVDVGVDASAVQSRVSQGTGSGSIRVRSQGDQVVISGTAEDAVTVDRALNIATKMAPGGVVNATQVSSPQQVMLKVRFLEVSRNAGRDLGVRFEYAGRNGLATSGVFGQPPSQVSSSINPTSTTGVPLVAAVNQAINAAISNATPFGTAIQRFSGSTYQLDVFVSALESRGLARRLAEPNLVAMSGDTADFLAGGEFPVPVNSQTSNGFPTVTIAYKEFGVGLAFTPTVLRNGVINLKLEQSVSELDPTTAVQVGGVAVPGLVKRRAKTTVEMRDGQSFAIAGLLQNQNERLVNQIPWLGSVPILGALFRSSNYNQKETELVVIVTPHLVKPAKPGDVIAGPTDSTIPPNDVDFFAAGKLDVTKSRHDVIREYVVSNGAAIGAHGHIVGGAAPYQAN